VATEATVGGVLVELSAFFQPLMKPLIPVLKPISVRVEPFSQQVNDLR
jgi:hypothetical protein